MLPAEETTLVASAVENGQTVVLTGLYSRGYITGGQNFGMKICF